MSAKKLAFSLLLCFSVAAVGGALTAPSIASWYAGLAKPSFNPPNWIFGPVWTLLYLLMAVSLALAWSRPHVKLSQLKIFIAQLVLNLAWSFFFFYLHLPGVAFLDIVILWAAILKTILKFRRLSLLSSFLLYPYLAWVSFAAVLNLSVWLLNP